MKTLRLALLMLLGALIGPMFLGPGNVGAQLHRHLAENVFHGAIVGALCGLALELCIRIWQHPRKVAWRYSLRNLLMLGSVVAIVLWVAVLLRTF
jgi:hypothetical protein